MTDITSSIKNSLLASYAVGAGALGLYGLLGSMFGKDEDRVLAEDMQKARALKKAQLENWLILCRGYAATIADSKVSDAVKIHAQVELEMTRKCCQELEAQIADCESAIFSLETEAKKREDAKAESAKKRDERIFTLQKEVADLKSEKSFCADEVDEADSEPASLERARKIYACAQAGHEANRAYCEALGDQAQVRWEKAPDWARTSAIKGVINVLNGAGPEQNHKSWLEEKCRTGWKYGPVKDPVKKEHPCFVPYAELLPEHKVKDDIFVQTVRAVARALKLEGQPSEG